MPVRSGVSSAHTREAAYPRLYSAIFMPSPVHRLVERIMFSTCPFVRPSVRLLPILWTRYFEQEAQLSQRDCAMLRVIEYFTKPLKVTQDHSRPFEMTLLSRACVVPISISLKLCISYDFWNFQRQKWRDLETGVRSRSRSLKVAPFNRSCTTF